MSNTGEFKKLHQQNNILHIGSIWDAASALLFEKQAYKAVGTSSAAIADALGYEDGEQMSFDELLIVVKSIIKRISIPLTVDIEGGYSRDVEGIVQNINRLIELGVVGVNLEDSYVGEDKQRYIIDLPEFSHIIKAIKRHLFQQGRDIFLNIRTDAFIMGLDDPLDETMQRAEQYQQSGADGLFVPCITDDTDIKKLVETISIPVNVMAMPNLPSFSTLEKLGVKRVSSGPFIYQKISRNLEEILGYIQKGQSFSPVFE
ncbi:MAG: isocitrate lyase/PEP mutase family protein [Cellvibrionaceae bacterium]